ncbi:MAG: hypothetical protein AB1546_06455 [bacterium]
MRKLGLIICLILPLVLVIAGCSGKKKGAAKYEVYKSAAHKFSVEVPSGYTNFETETRDHETAKGTVTTTMYQSATNDMMFMIAATPVEVDESLVKDALEKGRDAVAKTGEELKKGETTLAGKPALSLRYKMVVDGIDVFYDGAFAYIDGTQYQVLFGSTSEDKLERPEAKHFFESFKVLSAEEAAQPAETAPAAGAPAAEAPAAGKGFTFEALCDKLIAETKASIGSAYNSQMENQTRTGCMAAADAYKASPKASEAMTAFSKHIFTACEGKGGQEWLTCYGNESAAAGQAAANAMMK